jgi:hypothetical protein
MSTRLTFRGPADLSVGRVTVENQLGLVKEWVATPSNKTLELEDAPPGIYTANVEPVGQRSRSFVFEVRPNMANTVTAPLFSALAAGGDTVAFSGVSDQKHAIDILRARRPTLETAFSPILTSVHSDVWGLPTQTDSKAKILSLGLSVDKKMARIGGWTPFTESEPLGWFEGNGLNLLFDLSPDARVRNRRLRLSYSLEGVRVERFMVPQFWGGTRVEFQPSSLTTTDIAIRVTPVDVERRALVRALQAGAEEEARAVYDDVLRGGSIDRFVDGADEDPWAAMVATLLTIRFPSVFGAKSPTWGPWLVTHHGWAPDTHVIHARHHLLNAPPETEGRINAASSSLEALAAAYDLGSPFFSYSNQLMGEMLGSLAALEERPYETLAEQATKQLAEWRRNLPLQRSAGASFSWQMPDPLMRKTAHVLEPFQKTRGNLDERYSRIFFRGSVDLTRISLLLSSDNPLPPKKTDAREFAGSSVDAAQPDVARDATASDSGQLQPEAPALHRPIQFPEDPNKGRFGGAAKYDGHTLNATFSDPERTDWIEIQLVVNVDSSWEPSYSDSAVFFLHPTFNPSRLKATFRGHQASLTVRASGGFTVGVWLPERRIELECDLAEMPDAPRIIREL